MKVDLHVHTCFSIDGHMSPRDIVKAARQRGLNALAITDHNTIDGALVVRSLAPFLVIIGEEISTAEGELMALFLETTIPKGLSARKTATLARGQGGLVGVPHPFDRFRPERLEER
ncbi:MAG TPA: PHP domain-containing protein, partial [Chloroflexi bacterium]|nr:PHP domain-containing protein [Chloroflexota bacterium]